MLFIKSTDKVIRSKMKLFAIAAATVSARSSRTPGRVTDPAPGYVNEQGGYWADQPTHPQAPQPNYQMHQINYQPPQPPQCCAGYYWTSSTNEQVWLEKSGEYQQKPYYKGSDSQGVERVLFWKFDPVPYSPVVEALDGHWYFSTDLGDTDSAITESRETSGIRHCPEAYQSQPFTGNNDFRCGQAPQQQQQQQNRQCCNAYQWTTGANTIWMRFTGEQNDGKRVYQGVENGTLKVLFYKPANPGSSFGAWYMGDNDINDPTAPQSANVPDGLNSCPDQQNLGWGSYMNLRCDNQPPAAKTCAQIADKAILTQTGSAFTQCSVEQVMRNLFTQSDGPIENFIKAVRNSRQFTEQEINVMHNFDHAAQAWQAMTEGIHTNGVHENSCGFTRLTDDDLPAKKVPDCNTLCEDIANVDENDATGENMKLLLEEILKLAENEFDKGTLYQLVVVKIFYLLFRRGFI